MTLEGLHFHEPLSSEIQCPRNRDEIIRQLVKTGERITNSQFSNPANAGEHYRCHDSGKLGRAVPGHVTLCQHLMPNTCTHSQACLLSRTDGCNMKHGKNLRLSETAKSWDSLFSSFWIDQKKQQIHRHLWEVDTSVPCVCSTLILKLFKPVYPVTTTLGERNTGPFNASLDRNFLTISLSKGVLL